MAGHGYKVLSICGGLETGLLALQNLGIEVEQYHTYEIYKPAIELSTKHFPFIKHFGDVIGADFSQHTGTNLLIAGTCCQSLSRVRQEDTDYCAGLDGKSGIVYEYFRAKRELNPKYFLLENVVPQNSADADIISEELGAEPVLINSGLFSAQDRPRLYWTNIPIKELPQSSDLVLRDVMEQNVSEKYFYDKPFTILDMNKRVCAELHVKTHDMLRRVYNPDFKCATLTCVSGGYQEKKVLDSGRVRKLTPVEYERLQTLPDSFTEGYSDTARRSLCGNGWTRAVIEHIFGGLPS